MTDTSHYSSSAPAGADFEAGGLLRIDRIVLVKECAVPRDEAGEPARRDKQPKYQPINAQTSPLVVRLSARQRTLVGRRGPQ
jgi:hypothetical protein